MAIQQIIYNLEDYNGAGLMSTSTSGGTTTWDGNPDTWSNYENKRIKIFSKREPDGTLPVGTTEINLVSSPTGWRKMGIQGPPGTVFWAGTSNIASQAKRIMIGRSGIFELGEDIPISFLNFQKPVIYKLDIDNSKISETQGILIMNEAEQEREDAIAALGPVPSLEDPPAVIEAYWNGYVAAQTAYERKYSEGLNKYKLGINGIYVVDDNQSAADIYNIIIDYIV